VLGNVLEQLQHRSHFALRALKSMAAIPADCMINCWSIERLLAWLSDLTSECRR
jgi:hypothetical protein